MWWFPLRLSYEVLYTALHFDHENHLWMQLCIISRVCKAICCIPHPPTSPPAWLVTTQLLVPASSFTSQEAPKTHSELSISNNVSQTAVTVTENAADSHEFSSQHNWCQGEQQRSINVRSESQPAEWPNTVVAFHSLGAKTTYNDPILLRAC